MPRKIRQSEITRFLEAWFGVRQFIQASNFNRFQGAGLSATQFMTLNLLPAAGSGISMGELARHMNLKPATVAQTVDSLVARKLIERVQAEADKRIVLVKLTDLGAQMQNAASEQFRKQIGELLTALVPQERAGLISGLEAFVRAAEGQPQRRAPKSTRADGVVPAAHSGPRDHSR